MVLKKLREFLDSQSVRYTVISHSQAFTAQEVAMIAHIPGKELAKTVIVNADGKSVMAVVPASDMVEFRLLKRAIGATSASLENEAKFKALFPECEIGAMPPFGNLYGMDVVVADDLAEDEQIAFNAGTHRELIRMAYRDFERLVRPVIARISVKKNIREEEDARYSG